MTELTWRAQCRLIAAAVVLALCVLLPTAGGPSTPILTAREVQARGIQSTITFAVISDYGSCSMNEESVADMVVGWNPDLIVTAGDNYQGATGTGYCPRGGYYSSAVTPFYGQYVSNQTFYPSLGNHDHGDATLARYRAYFTYLPTSPNPEQRYYDFVQGDVHFFMVDSYGAGNDPYYDSATQQAWLQNALASSTAAWNIVVFHQPPYSSSASHGSTVGMRWPFAEWGADLVISGHNHVYERVLQNGIRYFTDGLGGLSRYGFGVPVAGSEVRYNANYGAIRGTASPTNLTLEFLSIDDGGTVQDTFTLTQEPTPTPTATQTPTNTPVPTSTWTATPTPTPTSTPTDHMIWLPLVVKAALSAGPGLLQSQNGHHASGRGEAFPGRPWPTEHLHLFAMIASPDTCVEMPRPYMLCQAALQQPCLQGCRQTESVRLFRLSTASPSPKGWRDLRQ